MTTVRHATDSDAPAIAPLLGQLGYPVGAHIIPTRLAAVEDDGGVVFVAEDDAGRVVGVASATSFSALHADGEIAYITALVADVNTRGRGVGRALVNAIEAWAIKRGCVRISVTSAEHRDDAHAFYPRCGFPYTGRRFTKRITPG